MKIRDLKEGIKLQWETKDKSSLMIAIVGYHDPWNSGGRFFIYFNGAFIYSGISFKYLKSRLNKLIDKWDLEEVSYDIESSPI